MGVGMCMDTSVRMMAAEAFERRVPGTGASYSALTCAYMCMDACIDMLSDIGPQKGGLLAHTKKDCWLAHKKRIAGSHKKGIVGSNIKKKIVGSALPGPRLNIP